MVEVFPIEHYKPSGGEAFFFDTNIWMYLFCPIGNYNKQVVVRYSRFFKEALTIQSKILVSSLVLSEFFNAYLNVEFEIYRNQFSFKTESKKDFRKTSRYKQLIPQIKGGLKRILQSSERIDDRFAEIDIDRLTIDLEKCDFNDRYYVELSGLFNFAIVTDDADFAIREIPTRIVTANKKILQLA